MSSTKTPTAHEKAIAALSPATGSNTRHLDHPAQAALVSHWIATFRVRDFYCEDTLEEILQTLRDRGADYFDNFTDPGIFEVRIPAEFDPQPYIAAMEMATDAITDIELQAEPRTVICGKT